MSKYRHFLFLLGLILFVGCDSGSDGSNGQDLPRIEDSIVDLSRIWETAEPEQVGMLEQRVTEALNEARDIDRMRSLLVVRNGRLVVEEYFQGLDEFELHDVRSITKSVLSTLVGIAHEDGILPDLNQPIGDILLDELADMTEEQKSITIRHLLTMRSGIEWHEHDGNAYNQWISSSDRIQFVFDQPQMAAPGAEFNYNSGAVHILGVVLEQAANMSLPEYADEVLFDPLNIRTSEWEQLEMDFVNGGSGLDLRPQDLARIGQLYLQEGLSGETRILPETWVRDAFLPTTDGYGGYGPLTDLDYGYLFWLEEGQVEPAYLAWGFGGQFIYIVPDLRLVVVATTNWQGANVDQLTQDVLEVIVYHLVPAARLGEE